MSATEICLVGDLGKRYGRSHMVHLDTKTPAEAMHWILVNFPTAQAYFAGAHERGVEFAFFRGHGEHRENIGFGQLDQPAGGRITIAPIIVGAKNGGVLQTVLGIVLIVIGAVGSTLGWWAGGSVWGPMFVSMGISMAAGGVVQMLSPQPKMGKGGADAAENQPSYLFNGPVNVTAQGSAVPVLYGGPMEIGSTVISAGIEATDYSSRPSNVGAGTPLGNLKKTPYDEDPA